jgi:hypothetical protein
MKTLIKSAIIGFALVGMVQAVPTSLFVTQNATQSVDTDTGASFTFNQFNSALGTLTAVDLLINSSTPTGSALVTNNSLNNTVTIRYIKTDLDIFNDSSLGFAGYDGGVIDLNTTPTAKHPTTFIISALGSQNFTANAGQSLIGGAPQTFSISSSNFSAYQGSGSVSFFGVSSINLTTIGSTYAVDSSLYSALTSTTLRYTYTPASPSPVPEPGQVAASLLLLGGIGGYIFIKRRRAATPAAA